MFYSTMFFTVAVPTYRKKIRFAVQSHQHLHSLIILQ